MLSLLSAGLVAMALAFGLSSCENDNINPYDYAQSNNSSSNTIVWEHDTTLVTSFKLSYFSRLKAANQGHVDKFYI